MLCIIDKTSFGTFGHSWHLGSTWQAALVCSFIGKVGVYPKPSIWLQLHHECDIMVVIYLQSLPEYF